jgi:hypothetical protein
MCMQALAGRFPALIALERSRQVKWFPCKQSRGKSESLQAWPQSRAIGQVDHGSSGITAGDLEQRLRQAKSAETVIGVVHLHLSIRSIV